jgi:hypothetical protein
VPQWEYMLWRASKLREEAPVVRNLNELDLDVYPIGEALAEAGEHGWELVQFSIDGDGGLLVFKRPTDDLLASRYRETG